MNCLRPRSNVKAPDWIVGLFWPTLIMKFVVPAAAGDNGAEGTVRVDPVYTAGLVTIRTSVT
jgi:hypothetical protein